MSINTSVKYQKIYLNNMINGFLIACVGLCSQGEGMQ